MAARIGTAGSSIAARSAPNEPALALAPLHSLPGGSIRAPFQPTLSRASAAAAVPLARDVDEIESVLDAYKRFCEELDATSASTLWRGVDTGALSRAFSTLSSQTLQFDRCDIAVVGTRATALCNGSLSYVRRVGDQVSRSRRISWVFELERASDRWLLSNVTAH